jgi:DNA repair exonuclease SbcCD ATPase subunit
MLQSLEIKNFQCHKNTVLEFVPGMNVITGSSDSGKSAIMRAIIWGLRNRPSGGDFKSWFAGDKETVEVAFEFDNGWFVKDRTGAKNKYNCEEGAFEALRSDVPEPIQAISNIVDYNIQTQFQQYFMLQDSAGDRAKRMNELVGLDIIDRIFKKLNSKISSTRLSIKVTTDEIDKLQEQIESLNYLGSVETLINKIDKDVTAHTLNSGRANSLREMIGKLHDIDSQADQFNKTLESIPAFNALCAKIGDRDSLRKQARELKIELDKFHKIDTDLTADKNWLIVEEPYSALMDVGNRRTDAAHKRVQMVSALDQYDQLTDNIDTLQDSINSKVTVYTDMLTASGTCPTCLSTVNNKTVAHIIKTMKE